MHMTDENLEGVEQEIAEVVPPTDSNDGAEEKQKAETFAKKSEDQDRNWKETRRKMQELERTAKEQAELINQLKSPPRAIQEDELDKLGDDDIITKGQSKRLMRKEAEEIARQIVIERENATVEDRLSMKFNDFSQVVTRENIELLKETEPELAKSLGKDTDQYNQSLAAYKLLKRLGIGAEEVSKEPVREKQKALANSQKPVSVNAVTKTSAIGNAHMFENGLTEELKKSLREEMARAVKGY
jgi:hypothetical protein